MRAEGVMRRVASATADQLGDTLGGAAQRTPDAVARFDPVEVDDVDVLTRSLVDAQVESRQLTETVAHPVAPASVPSIPGVADGVPVLDPTRAPGELREELARYAPVLSLGQGSLHADGAPVARDVARWLGHPVAEIVYPGGGTELVHAQHQLGASSGYGTLDQARFAATQLLGSGPDADAAAQGVAVLRASDRQGARRWMLAATDHPLSRNRETGGFWGASAVTTESPEHVRGLRYATEHGDAVPAEVILGRGDLRFPFVLSKDRAAPREDVGSLIPQSRLDTLSVVGNDPESVARRAEIEQWSDSLADRLRTLSADSAMVERLRSPHYADRLAQAEQVMAELRLDASSGWSAEQLASFRDALVDSGHDAATADLAMSRVAPWADNVLRVGYTRHGSTFVEDSADYGNFNFLKTVSKSLGLDGRAGLLAAALRSRSAAASAEAQFIDVSMAVDHLLRRSEYDGRGRFLDAHRGRRDDAVAAFAGAVAGDRSRREGELVSDAVIASGLREGVALRMIGHVLGARLPADRAVQVFESTLLSGDLKAAEANVVTRLREAELAYESAGGA